MTHRERVMAALSHQQPDTVPVDFDTMATSIVVEGYEKLKKHLGVASKTELMNRMLRIVKPNENVLQALDIDTRGIYRGDAAKDAAQEPDERRYTDIWGVERIHPESSYYYDQVCFPLSGDISVSDIVKYPWPDPDDPAYVHGLSDRLQWIRENTDCAAVASLPSSVIHNSQFLRGYEDWYLDFVLNTKVLEALFDAVLEINMQIAKNVLEAVGQEVDVIWTGDDLGTQERLQISPDHYLKYVKPRQAKFYRQIHDLSPAKLLLHSCGAVEPLIEDFIEIGVDVLNPVQTTAVGMDPVELKKKYGSRIAFWGGADNQKILHEGSVADVEKMVEDLIEQLGEGGGFVLSSCNNIQPDVPVENIVAMFRHSRQYVPSFLK